MAKITRNVRQQYENYIAVKSGALEESMCLMHSALLSEVAEDNADKIVRGSVISLNAEGKFVLGLPEGEGNVYPMPMFSKKNAFDPDVMTGAVGASTGKVLALSTVGGMLPGYVATGAFELESSEYDKDADYAVNTALVSDANGKVTAAASNAIYGSAKTVLGIVSKVPSRSKASFDVYGTENNRICFWPVFFPPKRG